MGTKIKTVAERIKSDNYSYIIKVNVPVEFYWNKDGSFGGISLVLNKKENDFTVDENIQIFQLLDKLVDLL